eukprot:2463162-Lingulodinium_polyedra.AAC.1
MPQPADLAHLVGLALRPVEREAPRQRLDKAAEKQEAKHAPWTAWASLGRLAARALWTAGG